MISLIWLSQFALRFADADVFTLILCCLLFIWVMMSFSSDEGGVTGLLQCLMTTFLCWFSSTSFWNNNTKCQDESKTMNPKKEKKKKRVILDIPAEKPTVIEEEEILKIPPPVLVDEKKKKNKKNKKSQKKIVSKENKESTIVKEKTKMYPSLESCRKLNRDSRSIYDCLMALKLTKTELKMHNFPTEDYQPQTLVDVSNNSRICVRCNEEFEIYNGVYLSATKCNHHPRKASFWRGSIGKIYPCCDLPVGSPPCTSNNHHVTLQHGPRNMTRTASRRHIRRDLQHRVFSLDCEMSYTTGGLEVTRIGVVDIDGCTVYDSYVKPKNKILDYNTLYSGVEKRHLENVQITTDDVKKILNNFIHEDTVLVGHALNNDLAALGLIHNTVVDTSVLYGDPMSPMMKKSLKSLAYEHLGIRVQEDPSGHDCIEDARTCLQLALLKVPPAPQTPRHLIASASTRTRRDSPEESGEICFGKENQPSPIFSREQQQPLMEIQNMWRYGKGARAQQDQHLMNMENIFLANGLYAQLSFYETSTFRYDPDSGCYKNFLLCQNKRGV